MKKLLALLLALSMLFVFASCDKKEDTSSTQSQDTSYTVTDSRGKNITFDAPPEKIISLMPSNTEIIYELGDGDKLIAVSEYCNYPEDTKNKTKLSTGEGTSLETLIAMEPDVIIAGSMQQTAELFEQLEESGIKIVITEANSIEETYKVINMVGKVLNKSKEAQELVDSMKKEFDEIKEQFKDKPSKKIYIEVSPLQYGLWTCGAGTFQHEIITLIGAENIFADVTSWSEVSEEQVIARNPDIIITTTMPMSEDDDPAAEIMSRKNWSNIEAVKNKKVFYYSDYDAIQRPGPRLAKAAKDLANLIYN